MGAVGAAGDGHATAGSAAAGPSGVAVVVLLLVDPALATSVGFALSVLATAGILLLAPGVARRPGPLAAALAGRGDRRAGGGPAGLHAAGRGHLRARSAWSRCWRQPAGRPRSSGRRRCSGSRAAWPAWSGRPPGAVAGTLAAWCVAWIVAGRPARRRPARRRRSTGGPACCRWLLLTALTVGVALLGAAPAAPAVDRARPAARCSSPESWSAPPTPGWPPARLGAGRVRRRPGRRARAARRPRAPAWSWTPGPTRRRSTAACAGSAVTDVPLLVLTHFHADHVDGIDRACCDGRGSAPSRPPALPGPAGGRRARSTAPPRARGSRRTPRRTAPRARVGEVTLQVLWPPADSPTVGPGDGSTANEASVVLLAQVRGRAAAADRRRGARGAGGAGPAAARACAWTCSRCRTTAAATRTSTSSARSDAAGGAGLGRRGQRLRPPGPADAPPLVRSGARVLRTDLDGDLAVVVRDGDLRTVTQPVSRRPVAGWAAPWQAPQQHPAQQTSSAGSRW